MGDTFGGGGGGFNMDPGGLFGGNGPVGNALGLSKKQGDYFQPNTKMSDWLNHMALEREGVKDETKSSEQATQQVQDNSMLKGLFGPEGTMDRTLAEEKRLAEQGYQLTPEDHTAYGQASGDISRLFGQQDNATMQNLANRGLASGESGAAGAAFSGAAGNKNEMLAKAQTDIANQRMQNTMQRLGQTRQFASTLGGQGQMAIQGQFDRNMASRQQDFNEAATAAQTQMGMNQEQAQSIADKRATKGKSLLEGFGQGLFSSGQQIGASPGTGASSASSSFGKGLGMMGGGM